MKKTELTHIIKQIVVEELRRELPAALAEVFQKFMTQKEDLDDNIRNSSMKPKTSKPNVQDDPDDEIDFRSSLKEMFDGNKQNAVKKPAPTPKTFTKNPILNEILNQTTPFSPQQRTGASMGAAAMIAASQGNSYQMEAPDMGQISRPVSQSELLNDNHVPLSNLPDGVSVMDVKQHVPPVVAEALTKNYSNMMKLIDKKKGKIS